MGLLGLFKNVFRKETPADPIGDISPEDKHDSTVQLKVQDTIIEDIMPAAEDDVSVSTDIVSSETPSTEIEEAIVAAESVEAAVDETTYDTYKQDTEPAEYDFPEWLLDESEIPPEAEEYIEEASPFDYEPSVTVYESAAEPTVDESAKPEIVPQVFINSHNKVVDLMCVLRRYSEGVSFIYCRNAASVDYLSEALSANGHALMVCKSDLNDAARESVLRVAAYKNVTLLIDDISALRWLGDAPSCVVFFDMPESMIDYQDKLNFTTVTAAYKAAYAFYTPGDYVVARHHIMNKYGSNDRDYRLAQLDELRTWFMSNGTEAKELSRSLTVETSTEQTIESCAGIEFVVTGKVYKFKDRNAIRRFVASRGGKFGESLTKSTHYLITNDTSSGSSKNQKAAKFGTKIISEDDFIRMFCGGKVPEDDNV